jgi:hypothetical protein
MGKQKTYSNFKYEDLDTLGVRLKSKKLFEEIKPSEPSSWLNQTFAINKEAPMDTEKAKSELIVVPILTELKLKNPNTFNFFSGYNFDVDKERGLKGHCDFLLSANIDSPIIDSPIFALVEAKNADIPLGIPQCIAEMVAARYFNEKKGNQITKIYGAVTNGDFWKFLELDGETVYQDSDNYFLIKLPELLGVLQKIIDFYKK